MGHNRGEVEQNLSSQFLWIVFDGEQSAVSLAAIALADIFVTGGAISKQIAESEGQKAGISVAQELINHGFDQNIDTIYGGVMTFQNWQDTPLGQIPLPNKFVPYVGVKRRGVNSPPGDGGGLSVGQLRIHNDLPLAVDLVLFHPQNPTVPFSSWHCIPNQITFLADGTNNRISIGSDWRIQVKYSDGSSSSQYYVGSVAMYSSSIFDIRVAHVPVISFGQLRIKNDYGGEVWIRLYHPQGQAGQVFATWHFAPNQQDYLALNNQRITIGSDWGIQILFGNGVTSPERKVASIAWVNGGTLDVLATEIFNG